MFSGVEYGARRIYQGQIDVLGATSPSGQKIQEMYDQERHHYDKMKELARKHHIRPTALQPVWHIGGYVLGAVTAMLGKEAAMACTVAVETEIADHYNNQLRELMAVAPEETELRDVIAKFRDDELHHLDVGVEEGAEKAPSYDVLVSGIRMVTRLAVNIAEKV